MSALAYLAVNVERFWARVAVGSPSACWEWQGKRESNGYGQVYLPGGRQMQAHRIAYSLIRGLILPGVELDHTCRNRACCNPWHLDPVSHAENVRRGDGWGGRHSRKTHCPQGHEFDTRVVGGRTRRWCRVCHNEACRRRRVAKKVAA